MSSTERKRTTLTGHEKKCFAFLRYALNPALHEAPDMSDDDWLRLYHFANTHKILGIVFDGITRLKEQGIAPPRKVLMKWISHVVGYNKQNRILNETAIKMAALAESNGLRCCLLKGQGNNLMYPNVYSRTPGDIDMWVATADYRIDPRAVLRFVRSHNPRGCTQYHHIDYGKCNGIDVEMHYRPSFMSNPLHNRRLQRWFIENARPQFEHVVILPDEAGSIAVPRAEFNAVFQLSHIYNHLLFEGIGMRQIIDYYYVLQNVERTDGLADTLRHLGLQKIGGAVMWVLHNVLHMEEKRLITAQDETLGHLLFGEIMRSGNFGASDKDVPVLHSNSRIGIMKYKIAHHTQRLYRDMRMMRYFPSECIFEPLYRSRHFLWRLTH